MLQNYNAIFSGDDLARYAMTVDVSVGDSSVIQFSLAMGCVPSDNCYGKDVP